MPTAISNILAAFLIANQTWQPLSCLLFLIVSSSCLYLSGMVLNDFFDVEVDRQLRPDRPIPSGRISKRKAFSAYLVLTLAGMLSANFASTRSLLVAAILVAAIYLYNGLIKTTIFAPAIMGLCRSLNVLLGASCTSSVSESELSNMFGFEPAVWWIALSLGIFISGLTWFARREAQGGNRISLSSATALMLVGIIGFIAVTVAIDIVATQAAKYRYSAMVLLVAFPIMLRTVQAIIHPMAPNIGVAISTTLRSLILFDAAFAYLFSQCQVMYPIIILLLLIPSLVLSRWFSPT